MALFTEFTNILPTPSNPIGTAGQTLDTGSGGVPGPGYAALKIDAEYQTLVDRTNSGRLVARSNAYHSWKIDITYNPMTRAEFSPIYSFLLEKQGKLRPFFITLPQYENSQDATFSDTLYVANGIDTYTPLTGYAPGKTYFTVDDNGSGYNSSVDGYPLPGDMFTINDSNDTNHLKAYKVTRVETNADYNSAFGQPTTAQLRIHFSPPLQKFTSNDAALVFSNPKVKVVMSSDIFSYQLKTDNLYVFSLNLEEVQ